MTLSQQLNNLKFTWNVNLDGYNLYETSEEKDVKWDLDGFKLS